MNKFLGNLTNLNKLDELEKISRRVFTEFANNKPLIILSRLIDLLSFHDKLENLSFFLLYLQFFNETTSIAFNEKIAIPTSLEESILTFLKSSIMNVPFYILFKLIQSIQDNRIF